MTQTIIDARSTQIAALNDAFRRAGPSIDWMVTASLHLKGAGFVTRALRAVIDHDRFDTDNDPYGEHDFGAVAVDGVKVWFKIDYYDRSLEWGSPDPGDPAVTRRILTVMLPEDY